MPRIRIEHRMLTQISIQVPADMIEAIQARLVATTGAAVLWIPEVGGYQTSFLPRERYLQVIEAVNYCSVQHLPEVSDSPCDVCMAQGEEAPAYASFISTGKASFRTCRNHYERVAKLSDAEITQFYLEL